MACEGKKRLWDFYYPLLEGIVNLDNLDSSIYEVLQVKLSVNELNELLKYIENLDLDKDEIDELGLKKYLNKINEIYADFIYSKIKHINFYKNTHLYQGSIVYFKGKVKNLNKWENVYDRLSANISFSRPDIRLFDFPASLRPSQINLMKQEGNIDDLDIRLLFVFSSNKSIRSYMYRSNLKLCSFSVSSRNFI